MQMKLNLSSDPTLYHKSSFDFRIDQDYFGTISRDPNISPLLKKKSSKNQSSLFKENINLKINVTDFTILTECPKLFDSYFIKKEIKFPHHPIFDVGNIMDKYIKRYLYNNTVNNFESKLIEELRKLKSLQLEDNEINNYKEIFLDTSNHFSNYKAQTNINLNKKIILNINNILFSGLPDLILKDKDKNLWLIDLKLEKFGNKIENFKLSDIIQVLIYTFALKRSGIHIQNVGFYYMKERTLIYDSINELSIINLEKKLKKMTEILLMTKKFLPKKCALCLICKLKSSCTIGKHLKNDDFYNPLIWRQAYKNV